MRRGAGGHLVTKGQSAVITVVTVGDVERLRGYDALNAADGFRIGNAPDPVPVSPGVNKVYLGRLFFDLG